MATTVFVRVNRLDILRFLTVATMLVVFAAGRGAQRAGHRRRRAGGGRAARAAAVHGRRRELRPVGLRGRQERRLRARPARLAPDTPGRGDRPDLRDHARPRRRSSCSPGEATSSGSSTASRRRGGSSSSSGTTRTSSRRVLPGDPAVPAHAPAGHVRRRIVLRQDAQADARRPPVRPLRAGSPRDVGSSATAPRSSWWSRCSTTPWG